MLQTQKGIIPIIVIGFITVIAFTLIAASFWYNTKKDEQDALANTAASLITDFDTCAAAGYPIMESYPRQCAANGQTYTEIIINN